MPEISNDNGRVPRAAPAALVDGQAEAAILLVESLIHGLIERSIISVSDAMDIAETAAEAKVEIASDAGNKPPTIRGSLTILEAISASLQRDLSGQT